jgi:hypothetical protein
MAASRFGTLRHRRLGSLRYANLHLYAPQNAPLRPVSAFLRGIPTVADSLPLSPYFCWQLTVIALASFLTITDGLQVAFPHYQLPTPLQNVKEKMPKAKAEG